MFMIYYQSNITLGSFSDIEHKDIDQISIYEGKYRCGVKYFYKFSLN